VVRERFEVRGHRVDRASRRPLAKSIAAAANRGLVESGVDAAKAALIERQRDAYPGGGMGLLSMPFARPSARTDHCFR
jgi:hypothetical protein